MNSAGIVALAGPQHLFPRCSCLGHEARPSFCQSSGLLYRVHHERMWRNALPLGSGNDPLLDLVGKLQ